MKRLQSFYQGKNVLVTGGTGFIGSYIAQQLCEYGAHVTILDDLSTGSMANIAEARKSKRFRHAIDTVLNRPLVAEIPLGAFAEKEGNDA